jgi:hypothetical protein
MKVSLSDEIAELQVIQDESKIVAEKKRDTKEHAKGWERGVEITGGAGYVYSGPVDTPPGEGEWDGILNEFGLDPEKYEINPDAVLDMRVWDMAVGSGVVQRMHYYRAPVHLRGRYLWVPEEEFREGLEDFKPPPVALREAVYSEPNAYVVCLADWQIGKAEGDGTVGIRNRIMASAHRSLDRLHELRRMGIQIETVYIIGMGDMVEACDGHYAMQSFKTDLNERQQFRLAARLFRNIVAMFAAESTRVVVASVGGNHGENRKNGKAFTDPGDNKDTQLVEVTADRLSENEEAFGHVHFVPLENKLWCTLDIYGTSVGFSHGHLCGGGSGGAPEMKQKKWISNQALAKSDIGDVDLFVTGHFHSFQVSDWGPRMWLQCPTQDGGSEWFQNLNGSNSATGTLTFVCGPSAKTHADFIRVV